MAVQRPKVDLVGPNGEVVGSASRDTPDQILVHGTLKSGAVLSFHMRGGAVFKGTSGTRWLIYGERGEIEVTSPSSVITFAPPEQKLRVHDHATNEVEEVDWHTNDAESKIPGPAANVARIYEAFADGRKQGYVDWDQAVERHRLLDSLGKGPVNVGA